MNLSPFETMLLTAIGTALLGIGGLISYVIKIVLPRWLAISEERNKTFETAVGKTTEAVAKIPEAIKSFELALVTTESKIGERISNVGAELGRKIDERRFADLEDTISKQIARATPQPSEPGMGGPVSSRGGA